MQLHVFTGNHDPDRRPTLVDLIAWLVEGFHEVGGEVSVSDSEMRFDACNVVFENSTRHFNDVFRSASAECRRAIGRPMNLVSYVTEIIDGDRFDDGEAGFGEQRYADFIDGADVFSGFITTVPANVPLLRRIAPTTFFEFGYCPALDCSAQRPRPTHMASFSGGLTPYRRAFIERAKAKGVPVHIPGSGAHTAAVQSDEAYRNLIRSTAVNLCLRQHESWPLPSPTRLARILHAGTGAAVDTTPVRTALSDLFEPFADVDDFCVRVAETDIDSVLSEADERLATYRHRLPMAREIARNIDECPALA